MVSQKPQYFKSFEKNNHWRKLWRESVTVTLLQNQNSFLLFFFFFFIHISTNMSPFGLKFSQMILHTETSKLMYNWSFLFVVLHKPTLFNPLPLKAGYRNHYRLSVLKGSMIQLTLCIDVTKGHVSITMEPD